MTRLAQIVGSDRAHALLGLATLSVVAGPLALGRGVDVPDDFLYSVVSTWEWVRYAVLHGENPFFLPGRMGGVALHTEATQMGPVYPAMWLALLMPVRLALPLAFALHAAGALIATRWLARSWGASKAAATAAALVFATGPFGLALFIEAPADAIPMILWFPVVLACHRRAELADGRGRLRWALLGGLALAALLTGTHIRHAGGVCGALGVWFLLRWRAMPWSIVLTVTGLVVGANGWVPALLELRQSQAANAEIAGLAVPPLQALRWSFAASWVAPKPFVTAREFGLGAILGPAFAFGVAAIDRARGGGEAERIGAHRALVAYVALLLLCAAGLPGVRVLLTPLTLLAHPVLILYHALAMAPAAVVAAIGLDRLAAMDRPALGRSLRGAPGLLLGAMVAAVVLRLTPLGWSTFGSAGEWTQWVIGLGQAAAVVAAAIWVLLRRPPAERMGALLLLLTLDLVLLGVHTHRAVPSRPLELAARYDVDPAPAAGYLHTGELAVLLEDGLESAQTLANVLTEEGVRYDDVAQGGEVEDILAEAPEVQARLLDRRWPVHAGSGMGWRSLSGRTKLAPPREVAMLLPLARALDGLPPFDGGDTDDIDPWNAPAVTARAEALFGRPDGLGARTAALHGIPLTIDESGRSWATADPMPRCYSPTAVEVEPSEGRRVRRLLEDGVGPDRPALVEAPLPTPIGRARVTCAGWGLDVAVEADGPALVVLTERLHPGWHVSDGERDLPTLAVNQVHTGVLVPAGAHRLRWRFRPLGLAVASLVSLIGLGLAAAAVARSGQGGGARGREAVSGTSD